MGVTSTKDFHKESVSSLPGLRTDTPGSLTCLGLACWCSVLVNLVLIQGQIAAFHFHSGYCCFTSISAFVAQLLCMLPKAITLLVPYLEGSLRTRKILNLTEKKGEIL